MQFASTLLRTSRFTPPTQLIRPAVFRRQYTMEPSLQSPLFTQHVVKAMRALYPEELADRAWDNVGLLQENINPTSGSVPSRVLLTNDLTLTIAEEAIQKKASVIVSYHPFIFRGLKTLTLSDPHQRLVLRLAQHNIAVYSPHTAADAVLGGVNDWLAGILTKLPPAPGDADMDVGRDVTVVQPIKGAVVPAGFEGAGYGRRVQLAREVDVESVARVYCVELGLKGVMVSQPQPPPQSPRGGSRNYVRSVAVCAGSGYDVLKDADADLIVTGEMSHHNALRLKMLGKSVITLFHSNSERGFLKQVLQAQLQGELRKEDKEAEVLVSEEDADPFEIVGVEELKG